MRVYTSSINWCAKCGLPLVVGGTWSFVWLGGRPYHIDCATTATLDDAVIRWIVRDEISRMGTR